MPEISLFRGIRITMYYSVYYSGHHPPHFHAEYAGHKCLVDVLSGCVLKGALPARQLKLVLAWDPSGQYDPTNCIDIDPFAVYEAPVVADPLEGAA